MIALLFMVQGMYRAFKPTNCKPKAQYVKTWADRHPESNKAAKECL